MPYFNKANILLIHIPKTGGTSLEIYFSEKYSIPLNVHSLYYKYCEKQTKRDVEQKHARIAQAHASAIDKQRHILRLQRGPTMQPMQVVPSRAPPPPKYSKHIPNHAIPNRPHPHLPPRKDPLSHSIKPMNEVQLTPAQIEQVKYMLPEYADFMKTKVALEVQHSLQHLTWAEMKTYQDVFWKLMEHKQDLFGEQLIEYRAIRIFTVVRNPYDRILSELFFIDWIKPTYTPKEVYFKLRQYLLFPSTFDNHKLPQHVFVEEDDGSLIRGLVVLRTETLTQDMRAIGFSDFNVQQNRLHYHIPASRSTENSREEGMPACKYLKYLHPASIQLINRYYKRDFEVFGYPILEEGTNE